MPYSFTNDNFKEERTKVCNFSQDDITEKVCTEEPLEECQTKTVSVYREETKQKQECSDVPKKVCGDSKSKQCQCDAMLVVEKPIMGLSEKKICKTEKKNVKRRRPLIVAT